MVRRLRKVVVLGMGNLLLKDEGIGVHVARALQGMLPPEGVELEVVDAGTLPDAILPFEEADKLIIVDAVQAGNEPGAIYRFRPGDVEFAGKSLTSLHQLSLMDNLWLMERLGKRPQDVVIIGVEPEVIDWGTELSAKLQGLISQIIDVLRKEISLEQLLPDSERRAK